MASKKVEGQKVKMEEGPRLEEKRQIVRNLVDIEVNQYSLKGYFNPKVARMLLFYIMIVNLGFAVIFALAGIWEILKPEIMIKALSSFGVIVIGAFIFNVVNEYFGE